MNLLGIDLAWGLGRADGRPANETGVVALDLDGRITAAGWTVGLEPTLDWIAANADPDCLLFVDAPLLVTNPSGQRLCEKQVGQRYGRWKVAANSSNLALPHLAGVVLKERLERDGWQYDDGHDGPIATGRRMYECYPYTTLVGAPVLGYDVARPTYKRKPRAIATADWRPIRAAVCDGIIERVAGLAQHDPPIDLRSHPVTAALVDESSPENDRAYKHREDLLDAALCAWTAALWLRHGTDACQILGETRDGPRTDGRTVDDAEAATATATATATIVAPARPEQRR